MSLARPVRKHDGDDASRDAQVNGEVDETAKETRRRWIRMHARSDIYTRTYVRPPTPQPWTVCPFTEAGGQLFTLLHSKFCLPTAAAVVVVGIVLFVCVCC